MTFTLYERGLVGGLAMSTMKREVKLGRVWAAALMLLWAVAMIVPAALPH